MMQYPEMRRASRALSKDETYAILARETYGVLSTCGAAGAYGVPINYVCADGHIYCHCGNEGHKLDNIARDSRVCFTVVEREPVIVPERLVTRYRSVIAFGTTAVLAGEEARAPLIRLCEALTPEHVPDYLRHGDIEERVRVIDITVRRITGKFNPG